MIRFFFTIEQHDDDAQLQAITQKADLIASASTEQEIRTVENSLLAHLKKQFPKLVAVNIYNFEALA